VLLTMFDARNNLARQVAEDVRRHFGHLVFNSVIPRNVRLSEAPSFGKPSYSTMSLARLSKLFGAGTRVPGPALTRRCVA